MANIKTEFGQNPECSFNQSSICKIADIVTNQEAIRKMSEIIYGSSIAIEQLKVTASESL